MTTSRFGTQGAGQYLEGSSGGVEGRGVISVAFCLPDHPKQLQDGSDWM